MLENINELLTPGNVFITSLDINPVRIIIADDITVIYEIWWPHSKDWSYKYNLRKKSIYYRTSVSNFLKNATYFRTDQLSPEEIAVHRPELPLYLCRNDQLSWTKKIYRNLEEFEKENGHALQFIVSPCSLEISKIVLVPFGSKGGLKKGAVIEARGI